MTALRMVDLMRMLNYEYDDFPPVPFRADNASARSRFLSQPFLRQRGADSFRA